MVIMSARSKIIFSLDTLAMETFVRKVTYLTLPQICFQAIVDVPQVQLLFAIILHQQQVILRVSSQVWRIYKQLLMRIQKLPAQNALRLALSVIVQMTIRVVTHHTTLLRLVLVLWTISVK